MVDISTAATGIDWAGGDLLTSWSDEVLEMRLLGHVYRAVHSHGDRRNVNPKLDDKGNPQSEAKFVDQATGLPKSGADLLSPGYAVQGTELVLQNAWRPYKLALAELIGDAPPGLHDCPGCGKAHAGEHLFWKARDSWSAAEAAVFFRCEYLWQLAFLRMAAKGWLEIKRPGATIFESDTGMNDKYKNPLGRNGLPKIAQLLPAAIAEAERRIPGTVLERGAFHYLSVAPEPIRANAPEWAKKEVAQWEAGT